MSNDEEKGKNRTKEQIKAEEIKRDKVLVALRHLLDSEGGRIWLWGLLADTHVFQSNMTGNSWTFFREGERNIGLTLLDDVLDARPNALETMREEFKDD